MTFADTSAEAFFRPLDYMDPRGMFDQEFVSLFSFFEDELTYFRKTLLIKQGWRLCRLFKGQ